MTTYSQRLDYYNRYQRRPQTTKYADFTQGGWGMGENNAGYLGDNESWTDQQAYTALLQSLPQETQRKFLTSVPKEKQGLDALLMEAYRDPQTYNDMFGYMVQDAQLSQLQGKRSALSTIQNPFLTPLMEQINEGVKTNDTVKTYNMTGGIVPRGMAGQAIVPQIDEYFINRAGGNPTSTTPQNTQQTTQGQNPSMWNYMLPALAIGGPMALLGGMGGGKNLGLGILGAAGLGALAYGYARSKNNWKGWEPVENIANTVNGLFGMGGQQSTQGQQTTSTTSAQGSQQVPTTPAQNGSPVGGHVTTQAPATPTTTPTTTSQEQKTDTQSVQLPAPQPNPPLSQQKTGGFLPNPRMIGTGYANLQKVTAPANKQPIPQQPPQKPAFNPRAVGTGYQNYKQLVAPQDTQQQAPAQKPAFNPRAVGTGYQNYKRLTTPQNTQQQAPAPQKPAFNPRAIGTGYQNYKQLVAPQNTQPQAPQQPPAQDKQNPKSVWPWGINPSLLRI